MYTRIDSMNAFNGHVEFTIALAFICCLLWKPCIAQDVAVTPKAPIPAFSTKQGAANLGVANSAAAKGISILEYAHLVVPNSRIPGRTFRDWTPAIKRAINDQHQYIYFPPGTYEVMGDQDGEPAFFGRNAAGFKCAWYGAGPWEWPQNGMASTIIAYTKVNTDGTALNTLKAERTLNGARTGEVITTSSTIGFWFPRNFTARHLAFHLKTYSDEGLNLLGSAPPQATVVRMQKLYQWNNNTADDNDGIIKYCAFNGSGANRKVNNENADSGTDIYFEGRGGVFESLNFASNGAGITLAFPSDAEQDQRLEAGQGQTAVTHQGSYYGANKLILRNLKFHSGEMDKIRICGSVLLRGVHINGVTSNDGGTLVRIVGGGLADSQIVNCQVGFSATPSWNQDLAALIDAENCEIWRTVISSCTAHGSDGYDGNRARRNEGRYEGTRYQHDFPFRMIHLKPTCKLNGLSITGNNFAFSEAELIRIDDADVRNVIVTGNLLTSPGADPDNGSRDDSAVGVYINSNKSGNIKIVNNVFDSYYFDANGNQVRRPNRTSNIAGSN